jgi:hypothetical protein
MEIAIFLFHGELWYSSKSDLHSSTLRTGMRKREARRRPSVTPMETDLYTGKRSAAAAAAAARPFPSVLFPNCRGGGVPLVPGGGEGSSCCCCCSASPVSGPAKAPWSLSPRLPTKIRKLIDRQGPARGVPGGVQQPTVLPIDEKDEAEPGGLHRSPNRHELDIQDDGGRGTARAKGCHVVAPRCPDEGHRRRGLGAPRSDGLRHPTGPARIDHWIGTRTDTCRCTRRCCW